jgi:hypothetical protein
MVGVQALLIENAAGAFFQLQCAPENFQKGQCLTTTFLFASSELPFLLKSHALLGCNDSHATLLEFHQENCFFVPENSNHRLSLVY